MGIEPLPRYREKLSVLLYGLVYFGFFKIISWLNLRTGRLRKGISLHRD
jgi:hypothetical protein